MASSSHAPEALGCARCRFARLGCDRCRKPTFKRRCPAGYGGSTKLARRHTKAEGPAPVDSSVPDGVPAAPPASPPAATQDAPRFVGSEGSVSELLRQRLITAASRTGAASAAGASPALRVSDAEAQAAPKPQAGLPSDGHQQRQQQQQQQQQQHATKPAAPPSPPAPQDDTPPAASRQVLQTQGDATATPPAPGGCAGGGVGAVAPPPATTTSGTFLSMLEQRVQQHLQQGRCAAQQQQQQQQLLLRHASPSRRARASAGEEAVGDRPLGGSADATPSSSSSSSWAKHLVSGSDSASGATPCHGTVHALPSNSGRQPSHQQQGPSPGKRKQQYRQAQRGAYAQLQHRPGDPDMRVATWAPPASPYGLLEEELWQDPWKLLVACVLLNKTSGKQVRSIIWRLFELCPTPQAAIDADVGAIQDLIQPLGLFRKRALMIQRLSEEYLNKQWTCPTQLHGIGKYGADAYYMFCRGAWQQLHPDDKDLKRYHGWLAATGGLGQGLLQAAGDGSPAAHHPVQVPEEGVDAATQRTAPPRPV